MNKRLTLVALAAIVVATAFGQTTDPLKAIKDIRKFQNDAFTKAESSHTNLDFEALQAQVLAKAKDAIKGVDVDKIDAKDAYNWAQLFSLAGEHKTTCALAMKYLTTNPDASTKFDVQLLMMTSCNSLGEGDMVDSTLRDTKPTNTGQSMELISYTVYNFADTIAKSKSPAEAVDALKALEANAKLDPDMTGKDPKAAEAMKKQIDMTRLSIVSKEADLLVKAGQKAEGLKALDDFANSLPKDSTLVRSAHLTKTQIELPGEAAPSLKVTENYNGFKSIDSMKGKVVILDFFAHWCGPCKASFPEMEKMYADLHSQGLEVVGITKYYGYYGQQNFEKKDMPKDVEYKHMADFIQQYKLPWAIAFGDRDNFDSYGVTGIPHVVLIDKQGKVVEIKIGYNARAFPEFRAKVEELLKQ